MAELQELGVRVVEISVTAAEMVFTMELNFEIDKNGDVYTECKYGGPLGRPGSSCAKARLVRPREFCFDCSS